MTIRTVIHPRGRSRTCPIYAIKMYGEREIRTLFKLSAVKYQKVDLVFPPKNERSVWCIRTLSQGMDGTTRNTTGVIYIPYTLCQWIDKNEMGDDFRASSNGTKITCSYRTNELTGLKLYEPFGTGFVQNAKTALTASNGIASFNQITCSTISTFVFHSSNSSCVESGGGIWVHCSECVFAGLLPLLVVVIVCTLELFVFAE
mmetsp:Transcript_25077/g.36841  ORF Transcript_25077/g.36841 Transcript_25077/m.36841 type:complete len:202 (+) Transcript_25077:165-770(+)